MASVRLTAITFPTRFCGVSAWIKDMICTVKIEENSMIAKQHTVITM